jgi:hypothetical protein
MKKELSFKPSLNKPGFIHSGYMGRTCFILCLLFPLLASSKDHISGSSQHMHVTTSTRTATSIEATTLSGFRGFQVENASVPFEIMYISVEANRKNLGIQLDWEVSEDAVPRKYEIEKSIDGSNFYKAGEIIADENHINRYYNWMDITPSTGTNYYCIRAIQGDGRSFVSRIMTVKMNTGSSIIAVFPNPVINRQLNFRSSEIEKGKYTLQLHNSQGLQIIDRTIYHPGGLFNQPFDLPITVPAGVYYLIIRQENKEYRQTIFLK